MSARPWHKRYHSDALTGYASLSLELRGAYTTILDMLYDRGELGIPDRERLLAGALDVTVARWQKIRADLIDAGKIDIIDGLISNRRFRRERDKAMTLSEKRAEAGREGGKAKANAKQLLDAETAPELPLDGENGQKTSEISPESEQNPDFYSAPAEQNAPLNPAENLETEVANAKQMPSYTRATPEARSQSLTTSSSTLNAEVGAIDDEKDEKPIDEEKPLEVFADDLHGKSARLARIAGINLTVPAKLASSIDMLKSWLDEGIDFEAVIVPTIETRAKADPTQDIYSLKYFDAAVRRAQGLKGMGVAPAKPPAPPPPPKAPIEADDGPDERIAKFRRQLAYAVGDKLYAARYSPEHVAIDVIDDRFLAIIFRTPSEQRIAAGDEQTMGGISDRLGLMLQMNSL